MSSSGTESVALMEKVQCRTWTDEEFDDVLRVWMDERPHLGLGNDSLLGGIDVSCIYRAYDVRFRALDVGGSCP